MKIEPGGPKPEEDFAKLDCPACRQETAMPLEVERVAQQPTDLETYLRHYGFLVGNPLRTDEEEIEMNALQAHLAAIDEDPGWVPVPRRERPRFPGR